MPPKTKVSQVVTNIQEVMREPTKQVKQQFGDMPSELVKMLYGDFGQELPTEEQLARKNEFHRVQDIQLLDDTRRRHAEMLGGTTKPFGSLTSPTTPKSPTEQQPVLNPFSNKQTTEVNAREIQTAVQEQFETAKTLGVENIDRQAQEKHQREIVEQQNEQRKKAQEKQKLETQIEAPAGRRMGLNIKFNRKSNVRRGTPRATANLRSAETRPTRE